MAVKKRKGGPQPLFCTTCRMWVPDTATADMRKKGAFFHDHVCGRKAKGEISERDWNKELAARNDAGK